MAEYKDETSLGEIDKFTPLGTKVVCIDASGFGGYQGLIRGKVYTLESYREASKEIKVIENICPGFYATRFEIVGKQNG